MQGEFRGDFTRDTYSPSKQFLRVFMQQGRVQVDADWNEQVSILLNYVQTLATDLIGPYGGPQNNCGFEIFPATADKLDELFKDGKIAEAEKQELKKQLKNLSSDEKPNFLIGPGHYYVQGKLCENQNYLLYSDLPCYPFVKGQAALKDGKYLVYLDVWERHVTDVEDTHELIPGIREIALGKVDTTTRSQLIWQVKVAPIEKDLIRKNNGVSKLVQGVKTDPAVLKTILKDRTQPGTGHLKARAEKPAGADANSPCTISPDSRYRGAENQLYRVEIHTSGTADTATLKWSRENGSVIFPVQQVGGTNITLDHLGWDDRFSLKTGDWVELIDDQYELQGRAEPLHQLDSIDPMEMTVKLKSAFAHSVSEQSHPILRRWDQQENSTVELKEGTIPVTEGKWIELENGVEICFTKNPLPEQPNFYTTGDYWLIPARTATGDVEWLKERQDQESVPSALPPHGINHYYAPLWIISVDADKVTVDVDNSDCRCQFPNLCQR